MHELGHTYDRRSTPAGSYAQALLQSETESFRQATGWRALTSISDLATLRSQTEVSFTDDAPAVWADLSHADPREDFANSFACFYGDPAFLQQLSPARYDWFSANLGR